MCYVIRAGSCENIDFIKRTEQNRMTRNKEGTRLRNTARYVIRVENKQQERVKKESVTSGGEQEGLSDIKSERKRDCS